MKTAQLTGAQLDYWVAKASGLPCVLEQWMTNPPKPVACWLLPAGKNLPDFSSDPFEPSVSWAQGGPIIERERLHLRPYEEGTWGASPNEDWETGGLGHPYGEGATPLIAAMRAYVASKFGDEIPA